MKLLVLVPTPGTAAATIIDAGSGIVARRQRGRDVIQVYFEGTHDTCGVEEPFELRVLRAAVRLREGFVTGARGEFRRDDFVVVGQLTATNHLVITEVATLAAWTRSARSPLLTPPSPAIAAHKPS